MCDCIREVEQRLRSFVAGTRISEGIMMTVEGRRMCAKYEYKQGGTWYTQTLTFPRCPFCGELYEQHEALYVRMMTGRRVG